MYGEHSAPGFGDVADVEAGGEVVEAFPFAGGVVVAADLVEDPGGGGEVGLKLLSDGGTAGCVVFG